MSMFGSYPLSRLGTGSALASSLTSVSSVTARGSSVASSSSAKTNAEALAASDRAKNGSGKNGDGKGDKSASASADKAGAAGDGTGEGSQTATSPAEMAANAGNTVAKLAKDSLSAIGNLFSSDTQFRFSTLLLVAVLAFLLGSLSRSTVTPVDFVLVPTRKDIFTAPSTDAVAGGLGRKLTGKKSTAHSKSAEKDYLDLITKLKKTTSGGQQLLEDQIGLNFGGEGRARNGEQGMVRQVQWTELRRYVQVPLLFPGAGGWDLVVGGVRRRG